MVLEPMLDQNRLGKYQHGMCQGLVSIQIVLYWRVLQSPQRFM